MALKKLNLALAMADMAEQTPESIPSEIDKAEALLNEAPYAHLRSLFLWL
jgi:hypothetical protein